MAWDTGKQASRTFRLDRIERADPLCHRPFQAMDPRELFGEIRAHGLDLGF
jgi:predicted DNA-binding transcriptional regulator YafY